MSYYRKHVFFCTNKRSSEKACCYQKNAENLRNYAKTRIQELKLTSSLANSIRINTAGCFDRCSEGPVMVVYPDGVWYRYANERDIDEIIESHLLGGNVVERLLI